MEYQNSSNSPAREVTETENTSTHKISIQIDLTHRNALTAIRSGDVPSAQQQKFILSIANSLKTSLEDFGDELSPQIEAAVNKGERLALSNILAEKSFGDRILCTTKKSITLILDLIHSVLIDELPLH